MWRRILIWLCLYGYCAAVPYGGKRNMPIIQREEEPIAAAATENEVSKPEAAATAADNSPPSMPMISTLTLPSNATSIRADITDGFSCANKSYGYYADVENDCQIFHVCLPVTYADGKENTFRWSFICPEDTVFSQESFTCLRREDMTIDCEDSSQYYELNRNFGMIDEENSNSRPTHNSEHIEQHTSIVTSSNNEDQSTAMTQQSTAEQPQRQPQVQPTENSNDEKVMKPMTSAANPAVTITNTQKQKPAKSPKPNRRKPSTTPFSSTSTSAKKKPLRKSTTTTKAPLVDATTLSFEVADETEAKPTTNRFTKRPVMSTNLKDKLQTAKPADQIPIRIELYNQKRKRPTFMNKKDMTTIKPAAENTESPALLGLTTTTDPTLTKETITTTGPKDNVTPQASETSEIFIKPATELESNTSDIKKITKPQPTEPDVSNTSNTIAGNLEEMPEIKPLEAFVEIPAVIAEVEESNTNEQVNAVEPHPELADSAASIEEAPNMTSHSPAIFQQNSEEASTVNQPPSIEEMEQEKPADAPETVTATNDMEHQQPMVEEMFEETVANNDDNDNKHTMGGFKPVDPAMAAEAEALIANFLNTLMKSEQVSSTAKPNIPEIVEPQAATEHEAEKETLKAENDVEATVLEAQKTKNEEISNNTPASSPVDNQSNLMLMHQLHQPADSFQIPVQVIQTPIEELTVNPKPVASKPFSIDDVVELVKEQLEQKPTASTELPTLSVETEKPPHISNNDSKYQKLGEELILPIYQRVSSNPAPNQQMLKAPSEATSEKPLESLATKVTSNKIETENKPKITTQQAATKTGRSIKTVSRMDPRKRRFLFRSDAS